MELIIASLSSDGGNLVNAVVTLAVAGLIIWLLWWFVSYIALPEPFAKVARVFIALVAVVILIRLIIQVTGVSF